MRNGWDENDSYMAFRCGPLGHGNSGHGHADALSFQLFSHGYPFLIDPGSYSYNLDYELRDYFRSTYAHNTITVDSFNQSEINDRMSWKTFAESKCNFWLCTDRFDVVDGEHNGYNRLYDPVVHRRVLFYNKNGYSIIFDLMSAKKEHTYDYNLQLHPECKITEKDGEIRICNNETVKLSFIGSYSQSVNIFKGRDKPLVGWYSKGYGSKEETTTINVNKKGYGNTIFLLFIDTSLNHNYVLERAERERVLCVIIKDSVKKIVDFLFYSLSSIDDYNDKRISFKGQLVYSNQFNKELKYLYAKNIYKINIKGLFELYSKVPVESIVFDQNRLNLTCSNKIINDLVITKINGVELFINNQRCNRLGSN